MVQEGRSGGRRLWLGRRTRHGGRCGHGTTVRAGGGERPIGNRQIIRLGGMDDRKKMKINVEIAGKLYRLTISAEEEERVRRAAAQIKRQIDALKRAYDASLIEYLAMAAMRISIENEENKERLERGPEAFKLKALVSQLDEWVEASSAGGRSDAMGAEGEDSAAAASGGGIGGGGSVATIVKPKARRGRPRKKQA